MMEALEQYISSYFDIGHGSLEEVATLFDRRRLTKDNYLLRVGQYTDMIHFVHQGYFRIWAYSHNAEKEITQWISTKGMFVTELSSFLFTTPSRFNIQALCPSVCYSISKEKYDSICDLVLNWQELDKQFIAKCFVTLENRVFGQLSLSAEQKVRGLLPTNPDIFLNVPLQYIASMLGMTPETLSRVRRKLIS